MEKPQISNEILEKASPEILGYIRYLENCLRELEARLNQNSQNSSKPPASDPPSAPPRPLNPPTGRKRGGQTGHKRHERQLVLSEKKVAFCPK